MRRIERLIDDSRRQTDNLDIGSDSGIQDEDFLAWGNFAQTRIHSRILTLHPRAFEVEKSITAVPGQSEYSIPSDAFMGTRVAKVEYSRTGQDRDYYALDKKELKERYRYNQGVPSQYIRRGSKLIIQPPPAEAGTFLVTIEPKLPRLDKRRAKVGSVSLDTSALTITSLVLDTTLDIDSESMNDEEYITIVDKDGVVKMRNIAITDVAANSGTVSVHSSFVYESGETITAGDWVCIGKYSSTHSQLPDNCEDYILLYMNKRAENRDSSSDAIAEMEDVKDCENAILEAFAEPDSDTHSIPITNTEFLDQGEW